MKFICQICILAQVFLPIFSSFAINNFYLIDSKLTEEPTLSQIEGTETDYISCDSVLAILIDDYELSSELLSVLSEIKFDNCSENNLWVLEKFLAKLSLNSNVYFRHDFLSKINLLNFVHFSAEKNLLVRKALAKFYIITSLDMFDLSEFSTAKIYLSKAEELDPKTPILGKLNKLFTEISNDETFLKKESEEPVNIDSEYERARLGTFEEESTSNWVFRAMVWIFILSILFILAILGFKRAIKIPAKIHSHGTFDSDSYDRDSSKRERQDLLNPTEKDQSV